MLFLCSHHIGSLIGFELTGSVDHLLPKGDFKIAFTISKRQQEIEPLVTLSFIFKYFFAKQNEIDSMHFTSLLNDVRE